MRLSWELGHFYDARDESQAGELWGPKIRKCIDQSLLGTLRNEITKHNKMGLSEIRVES